MAWLCGLAFALGSVLNPGLELRDIQGVPRAPLRVEGRATVLFFVTHDCPISNYYSHEIRRVCEQYSEQRIGCELVYVDPTLTDDLAKKHAEEYGHGSYPKYVDRGHALVKATGADVTPTAVVIKAGGEIVYRGRIDNFYADLGKARRVVTEHDLRDALDAVAAGKPVAKSETKAVGCFIPDVRFYGK